jgi:hypothetical protein
MLMFLTELTLAVLAAAQAHCARERVFQEVHSASNVSSVVGAEDLIRVRASTDESKSIFVEWSGQTL